MADEPGFMDWLRGIKPAPVLRGLSGVAGLLTPLLPGPAGTVGYGISAALGLAADLVEHGVEPGPAITEMRSAAPAIAEARKRLLAEIARRAAVPSDPSS